MRSPLDSETKNPEASNREERREQEARVFLRRGELFERTLGCAAAGLEAEMMEIEIESSTKRWPHILGGKHPEVTVAEDDVLVLAHQTLHRAVGGFKRRLGRLYRKYRRVLALTGQLGGTASFAEGCAAARVELVMPDSQISPGSELVEARSLRAAALKELDTKTDVREEIGAQNLEIFRGIIKEWDSFKVNQALEKVADSKLPAIKQRGIKAIRVMSEPEYEAQLKKDNPQYTGITGVYMHIDHEIAYIHAKQFVNLDGGVIRDNIHEALIHEHVHAVTTEKNNTGFGKDEIELPIRAGIGRGFYEGTTELIAYRAARALGLKPTFQAYMSGGFMAAYTLEAVVGTEALARAYLTGSRQPILDRLSKNYSLAYQQFEELMQEDFDAVGAEKYNLPLHFSGLLRAVELAQSKGITIQEIAERARREKISGALYPLSNGRGVILVWHDAQNPYSSYILGGMVSERLTLPYGSKVRIFFDLGGTERNRLSERSGRLLNEEEERLDNTARELLRKVGKRSRDDFNEADRHGFDSLVRLTAALAENRAVPATSIILNGTPFLVPLIERYAEARSDEERALIDQEKIKVVEEMLLVVESEIAEQREKIGARRRANERVSERSRDVRRLGP